jgi:serine phosphatase RsbU (regulator of sigma subunit)
VHTEQELVKTQDTIKQNVLEIELLNAENELKEARLKQEEAKRKEEQAKRKAQRRLIYFILLIFVFLGAFTLLLYKQMRDKKKANIRLQDLNTEIEKKNRQILDSINYASHIQEAILPFEKHMQDDLPNSFVFYKPRDIVSGDFYWHSRHKDMVFIAAIDCTGHGVPGAFMSMIGNTLLNEIVNEKEIFKPAEVLQLLNDKVEFTLNQNNTDEEGFSEDGMDITFCCFNKTTKTLELALANHKAVLISEGKQSTIDGDIFSIGGNVGLGKTSYTNHEIKITSETSLYMFSDGYQDQFGGIKNQKYMVPRFLDFLMKIQDAPFLEHKRLIEDEYYAWKGETRQIDDVLVIGARFHV